MTPATSAIRTLINDENFGPQPPGHSLLVLSDLLHQMLRRFRAYADTSERMYSDTSHIARSDTLEPRQAPRTAYRGEYAPVDAVTATASGDLMYFLRRDLMISRRRTDFPAPMQALDEYMRTYCRDFARRRFCRSQKDSPALPV